MIGNSDGSREHAKAFGVENRFTPWCNGNTAPFGGVIHSSNLCGVATLLRTPAMPVAPSRADGERFSQSAKIQAPTSREIPSSNFQKRAPHITFEVWLLELLWCLDVG